MRCWPGMTPAERAGQAASDVLEVLFQDEDWSLLDPILTGIEADPVEFAASFRLHLRAAQIRFRLDNSLCAYCGGSTSEGPCRPCTADRADEMYGRAA